MPRSKINQPILLNGSSTDRKRVLWNGSNMVKACFGFKGKSFLQKHALMSYLLFISYVIEKDSSKGW